MESQDLHHLPRQRPEKLIVLAALKKSVLASQESQVQHLHPKERVESQVLHLLLKERAARVVSSLFSVSIMMFWFLAYSYQQSSKHAYLLPHLLPGPTSPSVCTAKSAKTPSCGKSGKSNGGSGDDCDPEVPDTPEPTDAPSSAPTSLAPSITNEPQPAETLQTPSPTPEATAGSSETVGKGTESEVPFMDDREGN